MGIKMKTIEDECEFCSGKVNADPASANWHTWKDMEHGEDFIVTKLPQVEYYELKMISTVIIGNEVDICAIRIGLNYCPICGRRLTKV